MSYIFAPGTIGIRLLVQITDDQGLGVTGLVAATFPAVHLQRAGEAAISVTLADLAAEDSAWSSGGLKELSSAGGWYRLDAPDSLAATANECARLVGEASGKHLFCEPVQVEYVQTNLVQILSSTLTGITGRLAAAFSTFFGVASPTGTVNEIPLVDVATNVLNIPGTATGANTVTLTIQNGTSPIQGAKVRLTNGAQSYLGTTDANGVVTFNLDSLTWTVAITASGYTFSGASLIVSADTTRTYSMTLLSITPSNPGYTTGYATCYDETGVAEASVVVTATIVQLDSSDVGHVYDTAVLSETSDVDGLVQFPNLVLGATYRFTRGTKEKLITIPLASGSTYALPSFVGTP